MKRFNCFAEIQAKDGPERIVFQDSDHYVVPVVAVKEGILNDGFMSMSEVNPSAWEGVPVTLNHPVDGNGWEVSALSKEGREFWIGAFFELEKTNDSLIGKLYVNIEQAKSLRRGDDMLKSLEEGISLPVSVGFYAQYKPLEGFHNGERYMFAYTNVAPNHVAVLLDKDGACSLEDGCGTNMSALQAMQEKAAREVVDDILLHEEKMKKEEIIQKLLDTEGFEGFSKEELEAMSDCALKRLQAMQDSLNEANRREDVSEPVSEPSEPEAAPEAAPPQNAPETQSEGPSLAPEVVETLNALGADGILSVHNEVAARRKKDESEKNDLIEALHANPECHLEKEALKSISLAQLRSFSKRIGGTNYGPLGGGSGGSSDRKGPPAPPAILSVASGGKSDG